MPQDTPGGAALCDAAGILRETGERPGGRIAREDRDGVCVCWCTRRSEGGRRDIHVRAVGAEAHACGEVEWARVFAAGPAAVPIAAGGPSNELRQLAGGGVAGVRRDWLARLRGDVR